MLQVSKLRHRKVICPRKSQELSPGQWFQALMLPHVALRSTLRGWGCCLSVSLSLGSFLAIRPAQSPQKRSCGGQGVVGWRAWGRAAMLPPARRPATHMYPSSQVAAELGIWDPSRSLSD